MTLSVCNFGHNVKLSSKPRAVLRGLFQTELWEVSINKTLLASPPVSTGGAKKDTAERLLFCPHKIHMYNPAVQLSNILSCLFIHGCRVHCNIRSSAHLLFKH